LISNELKYFQALLFAFDEMVAALNELKTATRCGKNFFANKGDSFGVGINSFTKALKPLRRINRVAHYRIVLFGSAYRCRRAYPAWANTARAEYSSGSLAILAAMSFTAAPALKAHHETTAGRLSAALFLVEKVLSHWTRREPRLSYHR
jgi:hypothetical protein